MNIDNFASEFVNNHSKLDSFSWSTYFDLEHPNLYGLYYGVHRESNLLEETNWNVILELMTTEFDGDNGNWWWERHSHFLVGWTKCIVLKVYSDINKMEYTPEFEYFFENVYHPLSIYPILREDLYQELRSEKSYGYIMEDQLYNYPDKIKTKIYNYLLNKDLLEVGDDDLEYIPEKALTKINRKYKKYEIN